MAMIFNTQPLFATHPLFSPHIRHHRYATRYVEDDKQYTITFELPGVEPDRIKLRLTDDGQLTICVVDRAGNADFERQFHLEADADPTTVASWCKDGILEVTVAKMARPDPVVVDIQAVLPPSDANQKNIYELRYSMPGVSADEITVQVESGIMHISAKSRWAFVNNNRQIELPGDAQVASIRAFCLHGLLTIQIPRSEPAPPVTVAVTSNAEELPEDLKTVFKLQVPGHGADGVRLQATADTLHLLLERDGKQWERQLRLPLEITDLHSLRAVCADGLLQIGYSPRMVQPQSIDIKVLEDKPLTEPMDESKSEDWVDAGMIDGHQ